MSDEDLHNRVTNIEKKMAAFEARAEEREKREIRIEGKVDSLIEWMHTRQGVENAKKYEKEENKDERHERNQWLRALIPIGLVAGVWTVLFRVIEQVITGAGPK